MASLLDIRHAVADLLIALFPTRVPVLGWFGESPEPATPYFMYRVEVLGLPQSIVHGVSDDGLTQTVRAVSTVVVSVSFNGGDSMLDCLNFCLATRASQQNRTLFAICGFMGVSDPQDLTALALGTQRNRADVKLTLSASLTYENVGEYFETQGLRIKEAPHGYDETIIVQQGVNPNA